MGNPVIIYSSSGCLTSMMYRDPPCQTSISKHSNMDLVKFLKTFDHYKTVAKKLLWPPQPHQASFNGFKMAAHVQYINGFLKEFCKFNKELGLIYL